MMYTLSKLNMLILVTALAAIFLLFSAQNEERLCAGIGNFEAGKIAAQARDVLKGGVFPVCSSAFYTIPRELVCKNRRIFYTMKISYAPPSFSAVPGSSCSSDADCTAPATCDRSRGVCVQASQGILTFALFSADKPTEVLAAKGLELDPSVQVRVHEVVEGDVPRLKVAGGTGGSSQAEAVLDPQGRMLLDSVVFVKEVYDGRPFFHIIPCSATLGKDQMGSCVRAMLCVGCNLEPRGERYACFGVDPQDPSVCQAGICELGVLS